MPSSRLLERERELRLLRAAIDAAKRAGGSLTVIEGVAGIGKSQLLRAARRLARERDLRLLSASCTELERHDAFGLIGKLLPDQPPGDGAPATWNLTPSDAESLARASWVAALEHTVAAAPALLTIDDLHWCDRGSLTVLRDAVEPMIDRGCAIVVARRPDAGAEPELMHDIVRAPDATVLRPRSLGREAVGQVLSLAFGRDADVAFVEACCESCGGNPFLLRELALELDERGIAPTSANAASVPAIGPYAVAEVVGRRLDGVGAGARALAEAIAVLGDRAEPAIAAELAGVSDGAVADAAHELAAGGVFATGGELRFTHAIVQAAVLDGLRPSVRAERHRAAARVLHARSAPPAAVGRHLMLAEPAGEDWVVSALRAAAADAHARGAPTAAAEMLGRALLEPPPGAERAPVELELGTALAAAGSDKATPHLRVALETLSIDDPRRADAALSLARRLRVTSRGDEGAQTIRNALDHGVADPRRRLALRVELVVDATTRSGEAAEAAIEQIAALEREEAVEEHPDLYARLLSGAAENLARGATRREEAVEFARRSLAGGWLAREANSVRLAAALATLVHAGRAREALERADAAIAEQPSAGLSFTRLALDSMSVIALAYLGDLEVAVERGLPVVHTADAMGGLTGAVHAGYVALPLIGLGRVDEAWRLLSGRLDAAAERAILDIHLVPGYAARAMLHRLAGRFDAALADARRLHEVIVEAAFDTPAMWPWRSDAARALIALGDRAGAAALVEEELTLARRWGAPRDIAHAVRTLAATREGDERIELLREAADVAANSEALLERAQADVALGRALLKAGDARAARPPLASGLAAAERCGSVALIAHARNCLVQAGARPRLAAAGAAALTRGERRVAQLAAQGATNAEIAEHLVVSPTTVRTHLRAAFKKLAISSRSQLGEALQAPNE